MNPLQRARDLNDKLIELNQREIRRNRKAIVVCFAALPLGAGALLAFVVVMTRFVH
ncbi:TPA: hypothetical protein ACYLN4_007577 [Burkholderia lata]